MITGSRSIFLYDPRGMRATRGRLYTRSASPSSPFCISGYRSPRKPDFSIDLACLVEAHPTSRATMMSKTTRDKATIRHLLNAEIFRFLDDVLRRSKSCPVRLGQAKRASPRKPAAIERRVFPHHHIHLQPRPGMDDVELPIPTKSVANQLIAEIEFRRGKSGHHVRELSLTNARHSIDVIDQSRLTLCHGGNIF